MVLHPYPEVNTCAVRIPVSSVRVSVVPLCRVFITLAQIDASGNEPEIDRIIRKVIEPLRRPPACPAAPGLRECNVMIVVIFTRTGGI